MPCPKGKILNPSSNRCVNEHGIIGKKLSPHRVIPQPVKPKPEIPCPNGKILNPSTMRCVNEFGLIGKKLSPQHVKQESKPLKIIHRKSPKRVKERKVVITDILLNDLQYDKYRCGEEVNWIGFTFEDDRHDHFYKTLPSLLGNIELMIKDVSKEKREDSRYIMSDELKNRLEIIIMEAMEPMVKASGALPSPSKLVAYSRGMSAENGIIAQQESDRDGGSKNFKVTNYLVQVDLKNQKVFHFESSVKPFSHTIDEIDLNVWIENRKTEGIEAIFIPIIIIYESSNAHAVFAIVYPRIKVVSLFDPGDLLPYVSINNVPKNTVTNCTVLKTVRRFLNLDAYTLAIFADMYQNKQGALLSDFLQQEMEDEVIGELKSAMLSSKGFCVTWSRMAMYICMRTGIFHPRLVMGILQNIMRKNPPFMVACLAGTVIRGLADVFRLNKKYALSLKSVMKLDEGDDISWKLSARGMRQLKIDEKKAKEEYKDLLNEFL